MALLVRPIEPDDFTALAPLDAAYASRFALEEDVTEGSVSFFARSGHAFVAEGADGPVGFALAQAVWDGARPTLRLGRLALRPDAGSADARAEVREALLEAVTKSAYDAAVYRLVAEIPHADAESCEALRRHAWHERPLRAFGRQLGAGGAA